ncbi:DUF350 domain-containing protein [Candidatus Parcubacteria bacterium]|nr:MAG: DUF350 domain-containing protein [Candidatus Parcubacteria bacterium]
MEDCEMFAMLNWDQVGPAAMTSVVFAMVGLGLLGIGYELLDLLLFRKMCFTEELKKGNTALAMVISAFILAMSLIIYGVTN